MIVLEEITSSFDGMYSVGPTTFRAANFSCTLVPPFKYIMVEVTILKEICGFCDTTSLLYINGAEHVDLLLEILFNAQILCKF